MKIVGVIPAHMASIRFPGKILFIINGLPMIEHVRRRALISESLADVFVATCDESIASVIKSFGGKVIMTSASHKNGTTRVAEAAQQVDCSHVMLLQGDEPLVLPRHIDKIINTINSDSSGDAWNATGPIESVDELDRHSFVKCIVSQSGRIMHCFRRTPGYSSFQQQQTFVRKILGVITYRKDFLMKLCTLTCGPVEMAENIEQMRILEYNYTLQSIPLASSYPSINEPNEVQNVLECFQNNPEQKALLKEILRKT